MDQKQANTIRVYIRRLEDVESCAFVGEFTPRSAADLVRMAKETDWYYDPVDVKKSMDATDEKYVGHQFVYGEFDRFELEIIVGNPS